MKMSFYQEFHYNTKKQIVEKGQVEINIIWNYLNNELIPPRQVTTDKLAEHYSVSLNSIKRDTQVANAINAIGEVSPKAKMNILTRKIHISYI